jgi:hypothetical protein
MYGRPDREKLDRPRRVTEGRTPNFRYLSMYDRPVMRTAVSRKYRLEAALREPPRRDLRPFALIDAPRLDTRALVPVLEVAFLEVAFLVVAFLVVAFLAVSFLAWVDFGGFLPVSIALAAASRLICSGSSTPPAP